MVSTNYSRYFGSQGDKKSSLPKLELPDFIKKLGELTNND